MAVRREYIADLYRNVLGREGSEQDITGWENAPDEASVSAMFYGSPEYTSQHGGQATWQDVGGVITPTQPRVIGTPTIHGYDITTPTTTETTTPSSAPSSTPYTGFTPRHDYSAFNTGRQQDPGTSAKDAFAMLSNQAPPPPFGDRNAFKAWMNQYVVPGMNALGHQVISVDDNGFTYANHEGTFYVDAAQNLGAAPGSMLQRLQWNATPADDATRRRYAGSGSTVMTGSGGAGGARTGPPSGTNYSAPGGPGIFNGPVQQMGQDALSQLITNGLGGFLERGGTTEFGEQVRNAVLSRLDGENPNIARRFESARELMDKGRRTQTNDARAALANRGLLSEPGIPQGAEIGAIKRIEEAIAPEFSRALRDIYTDETTQALSLATGMASDEAKQYLAGIGEGTARQTALASIALQSLGQNMAWNQFLAEFGLKRDQVLNELQNGRVDDVMGLLNAFLSMASLSRGGYIGG